MDVERRIKQPRGTEPEEMAAYKRSRGACGRRRYRCLSIVSAGSQFEPITTEDRVRIAFEIANVLQRQILLRRVAKALILYGCPANRLEYVFRQVSDTLKVKDEFISIPNIIFINFADSSMHTTETRFIRQAYGSDMNKLMEVYRLEKLMSHGEVTVDESLPSAG